MSSNQIVQDLINLCTVFQTVYNIICDHPEKNIIFGLSLLLFGSYKLYIIGLTIIWTLFACYSLFYCVNTRIKIDEQERWGNQNVWAEQEEPWGQIPELESIATVPAADDIVLVIEETPLNALDFQQMI